MELLTQNFNIVDLAKFLEKNSKPSHLDCSGHIEGDIMQDHEQKKKVKKQDYMDKTNFYCSTMPFSPWAIMSYLENTRKMN